MRLISALPVLLASAAGATAPEAVNVAAAAAPPSLAHHPYAIWRAPAHAVQRSVHSLHAAAAKWASARRLQADCARNCQWKAAENRCDISDAAAMQMMMGGLSGGGGDAAGPMAQLLQAGMTCATLDSTTCSTNNNCQWEAGENRCDISDAAAMQMMMDGSGGGGGDAANPMAQLMQVGMTCATLDSTTCSTNNNCQWKASENRCDISDAAAMQMMMGGGGSGGGEAAGPMEQLLRLSMTCSSRTQATCGECTDTLSGTAGVQRSTLLTLAVLGGAAAMTLA